MTIFLVFNLKYGGNNFDIISCFRNTVSRHHIRICMCVVVQHVPGEKVIRCGGSHEQRVYLKVADLLSFEVFPDFFGTTTILWHHVTGVPTGTGSMTPRSTSCCRPAYTSSRQWTGIGIGLCLAKGVATQECCCSAVTQNATIQLFWSQNH